MTPYKRPPKRRSVFSAVIVLCSTLGILTVFSGASSRLLSPQIRSMARCSLPKVSRSCARPHPRGLAYLCRSGTRPDSFDESCDLTAASQAVESSRKGQEELFQIVEELSKTNSGQKEVVGELIERNEAVIQLLREVEGEIEQLMKCVPPGDAASAEVPELQELLRMRATLQEELFPVAEQIQSLKYTAAGQAALEAAKESDKRLSYWYPAAFSSSVPQEKLYSFESFGRPWVIFRDDSGAVGCVHDQCAHRACPLSLGKMVGGLLECPYHGWKFNRTGACKEMPSTRMCKGIGIISLPVVERDGLIWVWGSESTVAFPDSPPVSKDEVLPTGYEVFAELNREVAIDHMDILEALDMSEAHTSLSTGLESAIDGLAFPSKFSLRATSALSGNHELKPATVSASRISATPAVFISTLSLTSEKPAVHNGAGVEITGAGEAMLERKEEGVKGSLWQMHSVLPIKPGHSRILYRLALNTEDVGLGKFLPSSVWQETAAGCLDETIKFVEAYMKSR
ncbi:hypothetical protein AAMO2058_001074400 [Amorphochlora amoebiformis]|uniref:Rieske domain-containing protein n=1 Tax=Amorphochlora amoebiformis TaxID=1561963 RepID=A0A7S0DJ97_9EUKA|mmetsp:Transcript_30036/g.48103  ORF Transcript_30036/g.48103 Transcript_30036/m.48103 type:complete len:512 (+) Transcript_30036:55-1590(+)